MAISERQRRAVFVKLGEVLGEEAADHLMQMLPRVTNDELATRADLQALGSQLRGEMAELRADLQGQMAELRADVRTEIAGLQRWMAGILAANAVAVITALMA